MKRWAILTVLLYAIALILLTVPTALVAFGTWAETPLKIQDAFQVYSEWGYWIWLAVLVAGQMSFLMVPISISERRLPARRPVKVPAIVTGFFLANLLLAGLLSIWLAAFGNGYARGFADSFFQAADISLLVFWIIWSVVFYRFAKLGDPEAFLKRATSWLLRGSILELLIAVPSHIIVRRRGDCCAPIGTFWGIATGISVMLLCFGPGVFFLFVERFRRLRPKSQLSDALPKGVRG